MGNRPDGHSIDRIDTNGPYSAENCCWATTHEQQANQKNSSGVVGVTQCKQTGRWLAYIGVGGKNIRLGKFSDVESAISARRSAEQKYGVVYKERGVVWVPKDYKNKLSPLDVVNLSAGSISEALAVRWLRYESEASISVKVMLNLMRDVLGFVRVDHSNE